MKKCTGKRCPMQVGFDVSKCQTEDCSYRTEPKTNYDRIKNMSKLELANFLSEIQWEAMQGKSKYPHEWEKYIESEVTKE